MLSTVQPVTARQQLQATYDAYRAASDLLWAARGRNAAPADIFRLKSKMHSAADRFHVWRLKARDAFAKARGWRFDKKSWRYRAYEVGEKSRPLVNHPERFLDLATGEPIGIVTHTGAKVDEVVTFAHQMNYNAELLPFSWDVPDGRYHAIVLTLKEGAQWDL